MKQNEVIPRMKASIRKGLSNRLHVGDSISTFITVKYQVNIILDKVEGKQIRLEKRRNVACLSHAHLCAAENK